MAQKYLRQYVCPDCDDEFDTASAARNCHNQTEPGVFYICEVCNTDHDLADDAKACCMETTADVMADVIEKIIDPKPKPSAKKKTDRPKFDFTPKKIRTIPATASKPDPNCPLCLVARRHGKVTSCICMVTKDEEREAPKKSETDSGTGET